MWIEASLQYHCYTAAFNLCWNSNERKDQATTAKGIFGGWSRPGWFNTPPLFLLLFSAEWSNLTEDSSKALIDFTGNRITENSYTRGVKNPDSNILMTYKCLASLKSINLLQHRHFSLLWIHPMKSKLGQKRVWDTSFKYLPELHLSF